jgi:flavin reductase (DIM6/NTAB) family NADH-FMN oxidoreductase RutF/rubredoxin
MINFEALFKISYGLYIVCSGDKNSANGFISNTVFQITSDPPQFAACCNKNNYTAEFIQRCGAFSVSVLNVDASPDIIGKFGYNSGRDVDKMTGMNVRFGVTGVPVIVNDSISFLECKVVRTVDAGTHLVFMGELVNAEILDDSKDPMTYLYYRQTRKGLSPKNAPTYIDKSKFENKSEAEIISEVEIKSKNDLFEKFKCPLCGFIYDENSEKTKFADLPDNWICPVCGCEKNDFIEI